jgi:hypothetical protein
MSAEFDAWGEASDKLQAARSKLRELLKNLDEAVHEIRPLVSLHYGFHDTHIPKFRIPTIDEVRNAIENLYSAQQAEDEAFRRMKPAEQARVQR